MPKLSQALRIFSAPENHPLLRNITRGIEKESLRVTPAGQLATTPHPIGLGSALTNPRITTDYSEALLELITPPANNVDDTLKTLWDIHAFTYRQMGDELMWVNSMPCALGADTSIPIARYGTSNVAKMKEAYRLGLGHRYGRLMQTIAGIHYNWSVPDELLSLLQTASAVPTTFQKFKTTAYFGLIRNFKRHTWLLLYLFGAAPAICKSFVRHRDNHRLEPLGDDNHSLHRPYATSLRMGDLGYQSSAQEDLRICYNSMESYIDSLLTGLRTPYPDYEKIGVKDEHGDYQQLNTHLLQIENEFYSTIRPKRTTRSGETPIRALKERGVEYIEVRCIDLNPFSPTGFDREQADFLDIFLLHCLFSDSPECDCEEYREILVNQKETVYEGRNPAFRLRRRGEELSVAEWGGELLTAMMPLATLLDDIHATSRFSAVMATMQSRIADSDLTPSARVLAEIRASEMSYFQWTLSKSQEHKATLLTQPLAPEIEESYRQMAATSLKEQQAIEDSDSRSFEDYLESYFSQHRP